MLLKEYHMMKKVQLLIKNQKPLFQERTRGKNKSKSHYKESRIWKKKYLKITTINVANSGIKCTEE